MKALILAAAVLLAGCAGEKPSEDECTRVVAHIKEINGNQFAEVGADSKAMVRSCRALSSKKTVQCMLAAKTKEDLEKCEKASSAP